MKDARRLECKVETLPAASFPPAKAWRRSSRCRGRAEVPERYCGSPRHPCWRSVMENKNDPQEICLLSWLCQTSRSTAFILVHKRKSVAQCSGRKRGYWSPCTCAHYRTRCVKETGGDGGSMRIRVAKLDTDREPKEGSGFGKRRGVV